MVAAAMKLKDPCSLEEKAMTKQESILKTRDITFSATAAVKLLQLCPTLCNPIDGSPPGSPVPGILQVRALERVPVPSPLLSLQRSIQSKLCCWFFFSHTQVWM